MDSKQTSYKRDIISMNGEVLQKKYIKQTHQGLIYYPLLTPDLINSNQESRGNNTY
jgi:hypothetical protein